ncbi:hypothetical protein FSP39_007104 [Pinctada imbricata]|uniref:Uncharacterized protein n=1 Tax=Pinctada imbricata TaxID=66713 RepID=A0AA89BIZ4_PINIB|nr:hypothetical protein FSP39_007104 [Pinctada imbricata]
MAYVFCILDIIEYVNCSIQRNESVLMAEANYTMNVFKKQSCRASYTSNATFSMISTHNWFGLRHYSRRAKCSWGYRNNTDMSRIPETLVEAFCIQPYCGRSTHSSRCRADCLCQEVYRLVKVVRKDAPFEEDWQALTVGCTCMCDTLTNMHVMPIH